METNGKIQAKHLSRIGYVYIRQSTSYQVMENTESTMRQYKLRERLLALGWDEEMVRVIDSDLGISGKSAENREGFKKLVADVANGLVGAVACIEASRLSRNSSDWSRLIEFCSMTDTLLIDSDGVYNPNDFNDRMLLGLKGTMSEAELHFLQERMRGGLLNKAKRGELCSFLPIGYDYDIDDRIVKTSNLEIRSAVEQLFSLFRTIKSASGVVRYYNEHNLTFPLRMRQKEYHQQIIWQSLNKSRAVSILHNPFYTGVYIYGRTQVQWVGGGKRRPVVMPEEQWHANIPDHHEAYISTQEFEENQALLVQNKSQFTGGVSRKTVPREGNTLLQGICYCGFCGYQMFTQYSYRPSTNTMAARYTCGADKDKLEHACSNSVMAASVDKAISEIIQEKLSTETMSITAEVDQEIRRRVEERNRYFELKVESARYEAERARLQYMSVDPGNRLVASELEKNWNQKLRRQEEAEQRYQEEISKGMESDGRELEAAIKNITENFNTVWNSDSIKNEDRKRIVRYVIRDVTITRVENYTVRLDIVFQGGATTTTYVDAPKARHLIIKTPDDVLAFLEKEAEDHNYIELAQMLNDGGYKRECGRPFSSKNVHRIMTDYKIKTMKARYIERGWLTVQETAERMGITPRALRYRIGAGKYPGKYLQVEHRSTYLFDPETMPVKETGFSKATMA